MVQVVRTNAELLSIVGVAMAEGRFFLADEDRPGASRVAVITHELWQRRLGGDRAALAEPIKLDGEPHMIVGVLPVGFRPPAYAADVLIPLADSGARNREGQRSPSVTVVGRLRPGVTLAQAQAEMDRLTRGLDERFPVPGRARNVRVWSLTDFRTREVRTSLLVLGVAVVMVLLIACVNVANLLLARASIRRSEMAVRMALGGSRRRLVAQLLTESAVIGLAAGAIGVGLAFWGVQGLRALGGTGMASLDRAGIDLRALCVALLVSVATVALFGLGPALALSRPSSSSTVPGDLKEQVRGGGGRLGRRLRGALVAAEVALSFVLLVGAGLLLQSFANLQQVRPGFNAEGVMTANVALNAARYREPAQSVAFFRRFLENLQRRPGVVSAGITSSLPLTSHNQGTYMVGESGAITRPEDAPVLWFRIVSAGYFRAMGIPLLRGSLFDAVEERNPGTVVVNSEMAARYWPGEDPVGRRIRGASADPRRAGPWLTVVGVVGDVHHMGLATPVEPEMYLPYVGVPFTTAAVAVRTSLDAATLGPALVEAAKAADPEQAVSAVRTLESALYQSAASARLSTTLLALFAAISVALSLVGLGGVISYLVDQRTHEIGVRMALGARRGHVLLLVLREGMTAAVLGVAVGLAGAVAAASVFQTILFGVSAWDPLAFAAAAAILLAGALAGTWLPARRATAIDPLAALREP
jgi:putative ABC transport system permease protein